MSTGVGYHATTVAIDGRGVLIRGPSGSGKSSLALRLIDEGAALVADDRTIVESHGQQLFVSAPAPIQGKLEVRGLGIVELPAIGPVALALIVDLSPSERIVRHPKREDLVEESLGRPITRIALDPDAADATARVRIALMHLARGSPAAAALVSPSEQ